MTIDVVIAEQSEIYKTGLKNILTREKGFRILGDTGESEMTVNLTIKHAPHILLIDTELQGKRGMDVVYSLKKLQMSSRIVFITDIADELFVQQAYIAGVEGYIAKKSVKAEQLVKTLEKVARGQKVYPKAYNEVLKSLDSESAKFDAASGNPLQKLSRREREIFFYIAEGLPNRTIAKQLYISPRTVETHRARIIKKLNLNSTADIIYYAIKYNLVNVTDRPASSTGTAG